MLPQAHISKDCMFKPSALQPLLPNGPDTSAQWSLWWGRKVTLQLSFPHLDCYTSVKWTPQAVQSRQCRAGSVWPPGLHWKLNVFISALLRLIPLNSLLSNSKTKAGNLITFGKPYFCKQERNFIGPIILWVLPYLTNLSINRFWTLTLCLSFTLWSYLMILFPFYLLCLFLNIYASCL